MPIISPTLPSAGSPRGGEETDVRNVLVAILELLNGGLDNANIKAAAGIAYSKMEATSPLARAMVHAYNNATQNLGNGGLVAFGTEITDPDNCFATSHFTAPADGYYLVDYHLVFGEAASAYSLRAYLSKNDAFTGYYDDVHAFPSSGIGNPAVSGCHTIKLVAGDTVCVRLTHDKGSNVAVDGQPAGTYQDSTSIRVFRLT